MLGKSEIVFVRGNADITHSGAEVNQDWFLYPTLGHFLNLHVSTELIRYESLSNIVETCRKCSKIPIANSSFRGFLK